MFSIIDALRETLQGSLQLMAKYSDDYNIKNSFYMQAFGAVSMLSLTPYEDEARALWEEYEPRYKAMLWGR